MVCTLKKKWSASDPGRAPATPATDRYPNANRRLSRRKRALRPSRSSHHGARSR